MIRPLSLILVATVLLAATPAPPPNDTLKLTAQKTVGHSKFKPQGK